MKCMYPKESSKSRKKRNIFTITDCSANRRVAATEQSNVGQLFNSKNTRSRFDFFPRSAIEDSPSLSVRVQLLTSQATSSACQDNVWYSTVSTVPPRIVTRGDWAIFRSEEHHFSGYVNDALFLSYAVD